ncbi:MAG TPA: N-acetylglucosamine-6-phosphate deacetylase [Clostridiales bacterium]|nr:N-acetylglucosamine-6-phosphate deacetylase [Clostridiales bacterium]
MLVISDVRAVTAEGVRPCSIMVEGGRIAGIGPRDIVQGAGACHIDAAGRLAVPGFIDLHLHGAMGLDVMAADLQVLERLSRLLGKWGVTAYCPTTASAPSPQLVRAVATVAEATRRSTEPGWPGARVLGCNVEGPYLARGRRGAQAEDCLRLPDLEELERLHAAAGDTLRIFTLAPELPGALPAIRWLRARGIIPGIGHTDADQEEAMAAVAAGATHATHTFNAMRPLHHRDPGVLGAVLDRDEVLAEVIADGRHVHPAVVRLLCRAKGITRVAAVSDLTPLAGCPPGEYDLYGGRAVLTAEAAVLKHSGSLAGSVVPLSGAFRNLREWGFSPEEAVCLTSTNAAGHLGLGERKGALRPGMDADLGVLDDDGAVFLTLAMGRILHGPGPLAAAPQK